MCLVAVDCQYERGAVELIAQSRGDHAHHAGVPALGRGHQRGALGRRRAAQHGLARGGDDLMIMTDEQQQELQRFVDRKLEIRRELRQVQHDLQRDIDELGTRLKVINIALVPALVILFALFYGLYRRKRQSRTAVTE